MENTYNYIFWHNFHNGTWYAIPREQYLAFFNGDIKAKGVLASSKVETLVKLINNPNIKVK